MVTKDYKPPTDAKVFVRSTYHKEGGKLVQDPPVSQIRCTPTYLKSLGITDTSDQQFLESNLFGQSICPPMLWFNDSERARKLLKATE